MQVAGQPFSRQRMPRSIGAAPFGLCERNVWNIRSTGLTRADSAHAKRSRPPANCLGVEVGRKIVRFLFVITGLLGVATFGVGCTQSATAPPRPACFKSASAPQT